MDTKALRALSRDLKAAEPKLLADFRVALARSGEIVALLAKGLIAPYSSRIGGTIQVKALTATVKVIAGGARAPHAAPFENHGSPGTFRHPVFGNYDVWRSQQAHPFLTPAGEQGGEKAQDEIVKACDLFAAFISR